MRIEHWRMNEIKYTVKNYLKKKSEKQSEKIASSLNSDTKIRLKEMYRIELLNIYWAEKELNDTILNILKSKKLINLNEFIKSELIESPSHTSKLEKIFGKMFFDSEIYICSAMERLVNNLNPEKYHFLFSGKLNEEFLRRYDKMTKYKIAIYGIINSFALSMGERNVSELMDEFIINEKGKEHKIKHYISMHYCKYLN